ncbi:hypothetical protein CANINC_001525 [Pichia inconspicua]|uniref:protein-serine/threonine phosphatase n=1 Tax=Pichia inconspicua TaxID=52247 RepID=A0A4T0X3F6_9ASCO|nr:hypothetical protein CANINC_001525 [[Candida] inconspicua]
MGNLMSTPVTDKNITLVQHKHISHAIGEMQGYRFQMEDAYCDLDDIIHVSLSDNEEEEEFEDGCSATCDSENTSTQFTDTTSSTHSNSKSPFSSNDLKINIYGVFDGHGGSGASKFVSGILPLILKRSISDEINSLSLEDKLKLLDPTNDETMLLIDFPKIIKDCFMDIDYKFYYDPNNNSGTTAVVVILFKDYIITANSGDSRCILSRNGSVKNLSFDHKPKNLGELMRIHNDGGYVAQNRVNSILALSRAFGDFSFKLRNNNHLTKFVPSKTNKKIRLTPPEELQVTVEPDIIIQKYQKLQDEFLVVACDGIWDCYKSGDLVHLIRQQLALGKNLTNINDLILNNCISMANTITGIGFDNMTIIIIALHENYENLDQWIKVMKNKILDEKFGQVSM